MQIDALVRRREHRRSSAAFRRFSLTGPGVARRPVLRWGKVGDIVRLLVVEDSDAMAKLLGQGFREEGYAVDVVDTGADALAAATASEYDALVLDVVLPDLDGFEVCARLRRSGRQVPVLMLTARDAVRDRVKGLDVGADDYVCKPFSFAELCARVRALIRRGGPHEEAAAPLQTGPLRLDPLCRRVWAGSAEIDLSTTEFVLLELLMRNPGRVLSRSRILDHVWGFRYPVRSNVVDQYVRYLRHKVGQDMIETVRGVGYRFRDLAS
jgi:two-component system OmpR family response regulator